MEELKIEIINKITEIRNKESRGEELNDVDGHILWLAALLEENNHGQCGK
jgi:NTP pyrophosphatase (non-canonical NTP hydrolase)